MEDINRIGSHRPDSNENRDTETLAKLAVVTKNLEQARVAFNRNEGREGTELIRSLLAVARLRMKLGDAPRAERLIREAEFHAEESVGVSPDVLMNLRSHHGFLCETSDRLNDAIEHYEAALAVGERSEFRQQETAAVVHNNLAMLFKKLENFEKAEKHYQVALMILEESAGPESARIASVYNNLGVFYYSRRDWKQAFRMHERALKLRKRIFGAESTHYDIRQSYQNLAATYKAVGDYPAATALYEKIDDREGVAPLATTVDPGEHEGVREDAATGSPPFRS